MCANNNNKSWAETEFESASLGDIRLNKRLVSLADSFAKSPSASILQACDSIHLAKAAYRFFDNDAVNDQNIIEPHVSATKKRLLNIKTVLAVQDTTQLDFSHHPATKGLGILNDESHQGLFYHPTLLITPDKVPIGILHHNVWQRDLKDFGKRHKRKELPISEKESQRWLDSLKKTALLQQEMSDLHIVNIADREADIFDYFLLSFNLKTDILVRAAWNRCTDAPEKYLWEHMENAPISGNVTITVPRKKGKPSREATLSIRHSNISLMPPKHRASERLNPVTVWAVYANEDNPPSGEEPVSWMLITTIPVSSFEEALEKVHWYLVRWQIELFFKVLKSGCRIEQRQFEHAERIKRCLPLYAVIAWRVLYLTMESRRVPDMPCDALLEPEEWQALYCFVNKTKKPPKTPPSLKEATRMIAKLGGFPGRKSDGHPGTATIWKGLQRLHDIAIAWSLARSP